MNLQNYEEYWQLTNAFTDYNGKGFLKTLQVCLEFIDEYKAEAYSEDKYSRLQTRVESHLDINLISVRKAINQLVKMGFINSFLRSYPKDSIDYLNAKTNKKRLSLLSKIVYSNSSFNRAVNKDSNLRQLNFLIQTLIENGQLTKNEIIALMLVDIESVSKGYLDKKELLHFENLAIQSKFIERKYNQIGYLSNLLNKLDDIVFINGILYFEEDAKRIFGDSLRDDKKGRDPYLHRLYKNQLQEESIYHLADTKCMVEKLAYPVLIASHIKPFSKCNEIEAYDANNGILLSRNMDVLFDLGYITFDNNGKIIFATQLHQDVINFVSNYSLDKIFLNDKRLTFLDFHRNEVFEKRYKSA
jgi:putative restriction endonuclease